MYKKCENCYRDGKTPDEESCKRCEDDFKAKEQKLDKIKEIMNYYSGIHCSKCKNYKTCTTIDDCVNTIKIEVLHIIEGKENG